MTSASRCQALAAQAGALAAEAKADRCLVVAPRLTDRTREFLERQGIDYIDLRGDIRVTVPGRLLVMTHRVREPSAPYLPDTKDRVANPFAGKASRIVRALLAEPRRWWGLTELAERLTCLGVGYGLSRLSAAKFIEPFAPARVVDIYLERDPMDLAPKLDLFPVESGESVRLVQPADEGVLQFTEERQGVTLVNSAQLFVDLSNARGREGDVAERLLEHRLVGMWKEEVEG